MPWSKYNYLGKLQKHGPDSSLRLAPLQPVQEPSMADGDIFAEEAPFTVAGTHVRCVREIKIDSMKRKKT